MRPRSFLPRERLGWGREHNQLQADSDLAHKHRVYDVPSDGQRSPPHRHGQLGCRPVDAMRQARGYERPSRLENHVVTVTSRGGALSVRSACHAPLGWLWTRDSCTLPQPYAPPSTRHSGRWDGAGLAVGHPFPDSGPLRAPALRRLRTGVGPLALLEGSAS